MPTLACIVEKGFRTKAFVFTACVEFWFAVFAKLFNSLKTLHFNRKLWQIWKMGLRFTARGEFIYSFWGKDLISWKLSILVEKFDKLEIDLQLAKNFIYSSVKRLNCLKTLHLNWTIFQTWKTDIGFTVCGEFYLQLLRKFLMTWKSAFQLKMSSKLKRLIKDVQHLKKLICSFRQTF